MPIPQLRSPRSPQSWKSGGNRRRARSPRAKNLFAAGRLPALPPRLKRFLMMIMLVGIISGGGALWWIVRDLPSVDNIIERPTAVSTKLYDRTGTTVLYELYADEKRTPISLRDLPDHIKWATIVREDRNFYQHHGLSLRGIARSAFRFVINLGPSGGGGSTLTQQFVKNAVLSNEQTFTRKVKEAVLTWRIERSFSKDQILEMYLNEIPYGGSLYGIEAAARTFLGKSAKETSLAEAAMLAVIPKAPTYYSPYGSHRKELFNAQHYLLNQMAEHGYITHETAADAIQKEILFQPFRDAIIAPHFVMYVRELLSEKYGEAEARQGGLKVVTTLDTRLQVIAEKAIKEGAARNEKDFNAGNAALLSLNPKNGEILAMVGSRDYFDTAHDGNFNVTLAPRQPGSSFKPIVYATLFTRGGYSPDTALFDVNTIFKTDTGKDYAPKNYDDKERGPLSVRKALAGSLNTPAVKAIYLAGIDQVLTQAEKMGYTTLSDRSRFGLSLVLGGGEVKLIEHLPAIASLGQDGKYVSPVAILKIEDKKGDNVFEYRKKEGNTVIDAQVARQITSILSDNEARTYIFGGQSRLQLGARPVAAKTGTTNDYRDAWTVGYTPSLAAGVWVGNNDFSSMKRGADGSVVAAPIWNTYMQSALEGTPLEEFAKPESKDLPDKPMLNGKVEGGATVHIDKASGKLATPLTPPSYIMEYNSGEVHTILQYVNRDDPAGKIPEHPAQDPQYQNWEEAVQRWAKANGYTASSSITPPTEYDDLHTEANRPSLTVLAPQNNTAIAGQTVTVHTEASATRGIKKIEINVDGKILATMTTPPYTTTIGLQGYANGEHQLTIKALDDIDNSAVQSIIIQLNNANSGGNAASLTWLTPSSGARLKTGSFPQPVALKTNERDIQKIDLYIRESSGNKTFFLGVAVEGDGRYTFVWDESPAPGKYRLSSIITKQNESTIEGNGIDVEIIP